jgi:hypothetical protein
MTKCPKCGAEIKYIPVGYNIEEMGVAIVDPKYTEIINDGGRLIKGHLRHCCPETVNEDVKIDEMAILRDSL